MPKASLTEALTWVFTGLTLGVTAGSSVAGVAVDRWGAEAAFAVPAVGAALAALLALAGMPLLRRTTPLRAHAAAEVEPVPGPTARVGGPGAG